MRAMYIKLAISGNQVLVNNTEGDHTQMVQGAAALLLSVSKQTGIDMDEILSLLKKDIVNTQTGDMKCG